MTDAAPAAPAPPALLLFDIDGTLLAKASMEHAAALWQALHDVHGVVREQVPSPPPRSDAAGRTDGEIARQILVRAGIDARRIDGRAHAVAAETARHFTQLCPDDLSDKVIPGIPQLLAALSARDDVRLALLTGNYEPVARLKLRRAGIGRFFESGQGGFGSDSEDRTALPLVARRRAGEVGRPYPRERTIVIGDTPRDIACARADGVRCVAVATGPIPISELGEADAVAADAGELARALDTLIAAAGA